MIIALDSQLRERLLKNKDILSAFESFKKTPKHVSDTEYFKETFTCESTPCPDEILADIFLAKILNATISELILNPPTEIVLKNINETSWEEALKATKKQLRNDDLL